MHGAKCYWPCEAVPVVVVVVPVVVDVVPDEVVDVVAAVDAEAAASLVTLVTFQEMPSRTREMV